MSGDAWICIYRTWRYTENAHNCILQESGFQGKPAGELLEIQSERLTDPCLNSEAPPMDRLTEGRKTISIVFYNTFSEKENIIPDKSTETNY